MEELSSQGSVQANIDLMTFMVTELLRDLICHAGDWERVRPWPRPLPAGRGPDGADGRTPDEEASKKKKKRRCWLVSYYLQGTKRPTTWRPSTERPRLRSRYPRYSVGIKLGNSSLTAIRTTFYTISAPGAKTCSVPGAAETTMRNPPLNQQEGVLLGTPTVCNIL